MGLLTPSYVGLSSGGERRWRVPLRLAGGSLRQRCLESACRVSQCLRSANEAARPVTVLEVGSTGFVSRVANSGFDLTTCVTRRARAGAAGTTNSSALKKPPGGTLFRKSQCLLCLVGALRQVRRRSARTYAPCGMSIALSLVCVREKVSAVLASRSIVTI